MKEMPWEKLACALLAGTLALAGWGLWKVDLVDERTARMEERMLIWHSGSSGGNEAMLAGSYKAGLTCGQRLEFMQRAGVRAYEQVKGGAYDSALRTIMIGLEDSGMHCKEYRGGLRCE